MAPKPLPYASLRAHLYRLLHGRALLSGRPVRLTRAELMGAFPRGGEQCPGLPPSYDAEVYELHGDNDLRPLA